VTNVRYDGFRKLSINENGGAADKDIEPYDTKGCQTTAAMKGAETRRAELIDMIDLRTVGASGL
jgi:hypothetical protein